MNVFDTKYGFMTTCPRFFIIYLCSVGEMLYFGDRNRRVGTIFTRAYLQVSVGSLNLECCPCLSCNVME